MIYNRYTNLVTFCEKIWKIKNTTVGTVPKFNWPIGETDANLIPLTHIHLKSLLS